MISNTSRETDSPPPFPISTIRAVIFDFDGVIADTEALHWTTFVATLETFSIPLPDDCDRTRFLGIHDRACFKIVLARSDRETSSELLDQLVEHKSALYARGVAEVRLFPGVERVLTESLARGPCTIASGGRRVDIEAVLASHDLLAAMPRFISADEVDEAKPSPACFLAALELLRRSFGASIRAEECLVFEDSLRGVAAARRAGMRCVAVSNSYARDELREADLVVESLEAWSWDSR